MLWRAHFGYTSVNFKPQVANPRLKRAQFRPERAPRKLNGQKTTSFHFLRGALPWLLSPSHPVTRALAAPLCMLTCMYLWMHHTCHHAYKQLLYCNYGSEV